jgi:hypothetical protein
MRIRGEYLWSSMFVIAVLLTGSCDDGNGVTDPIVDVEAPSVALTAAPATGELDHELSLSFTVTDDVALEVVTVDWGIDGAPVESIPVAGRTYSGSCTHTFAEPGEYTIVVEATDASGRRAGVTHEVSIAWPPPGSPANVAVAVTDNRAALSWTPGSWGTGQEIVMSRLDAAEPDRVQVLGNNGTASFLLTDLAWDASYSVVVATSNPVGRAASAPVELQVRAPEPPVLTRFSAVAADPTCLLIAWDPAEAVENYRIVVTGDAVGDSFEELLPAAATAVELCSATYPIVDGMTYAGQVMSLLGGREYSSNSLEYTVDLDPSFTASGAWSGTWLSPAPALILLEFQLDDAEGAITGQWAEFDADGEPLASGPVYGTRVWGAVELTFEDFGSSEITGTLTGEFIDEETIEGTLDLGPFEVPVEMTRG